MNHEKTYNCLSVDKKPYSFDKDGKHHEGVTTVCAFAVYVDGTFREYFLGKVSPHCTSIKPNTLYTTIHYDEYGRVIEVID